MPLQVVADLIVFHILVGIACRAFRGEPAGVVGCEGRSERHRSFPKIWPRRMQEPGLYAESLHARQEISAKKRWKRR